MKTYKIFVKWEGANQQETLTGKLWVEDSYYNIVDENDKNWYFLMGRTVIEEQ